VGLSLLLPFHLSLLALSLSSFVRGNQGDEGRVEIRDSTESSADYRNTGLLSFGEAEEGSEAGPSKEQERKRKGLTRMDRTSFICSRIWTGADG
jgi:hypothetical protein